MPCVSCTGLILEKLLKPGPADEDSDAQCSSEDKSSDIRYQLHPSFSALQLSALEGCQTCQAIYQICCDCLDSEMDVGSSSITKEELLSDSIESPVSVSLHLSQLSWKYKYPALSHLWLQIGSSDQPPPPFRETIFHARSANPAHFTPRKVSPLLPVYIPFLLSSPRGKHIHMQFNTVFQY